jgi:DHA1 family multidrug resistance protein-like MFS transporter
MKELIRDTVFGHFLRIITKKKALPYEEERDPELWKQYIHHEKSANMARYGQVDVPESNNEEGEQSNDNNSGDQRPIGNERNQDHRHRNSSDTRVGSQDNTRRNDASGAVIDSEKGRDLTIVHWFGDNDPEVHQ